MTPREVAAATTLQLHGGMDPDGSRYLATRVVEAIDRVAPSSQIPAWAMRMRDALAQISELMNDYIESGGEPEYQPSPERIHRIAQRALNPDEWEMAR